MTMSSSTGKKMSEMAKVASTGKIYLNDTITSITQNLLTQTISASFCSLYFTFT